IGKLFLLRKIIFIIAFIYFAFSHYLFMMLGAKRQFFFFLALFCIATCMIRIFIM
ncbi:hypothetical protein ACJX0J_023358, partial [Zea mays]